MDIHCFSLRTQWYIKIFTRPWQGDVVWIISWNAKTSCGQKRYQLVSQNPRMVARLRWSVSKTWWFLIMVYTKHSITRHFVKQTIYLWHETHVCAPNKIARRKKYNSINIHTQYRRYLDSCVEHIDLETAGNQIWTSYNIKWNLLKR